MNLSSSFPKQIHSGIQELSERMEKAVGEFKLRFGDGKFAKVGVSLGSSCYPNDGKTIDQIIIAADKKMYEVKAKRNLNKTSDVIRFKPKVNAKLVRKSKLTEENFIVEVDESHIISTAIN